MPDQYDYGYEFEGTGIYSLMPGGSWTRWPNAVQYSGNTPVHLDAWSKTYLGFGKLANIISNTKTSQTFTLQPASKGGGIVKIIVPNSGVFVKNIVVTSLNRANGGSITFTAGIE